MGAVAARCSDVSMDKGGSNKPLDASSSEEEEDDEEEEDSEGEEDDGEDRKEAVAALEDGLKRGKTTAFKEVIDHATAIGIDDEKIMKAEAMLEQHKATRRREAFEQELQAFMESSEVDSLEACEQKLRQGEGYGATESALGPLLEKIEELKLRQELRQDELMQAKNFMELCTRRFVSATVVGKSIGWVDFQGGKVQKAILVVDNALKFMKVFNINRDTVLAECRLADCVPKRAADSDEVLESEAYDKLSDVQRELCVCCMGAGDDPWMFIEDSKRAVDDLVIALTILNGLGMDAGAAKAKKGKKKKEKGESPPVSPRKMSPRGQEAAAEDGMVSPRRERRTSTTASVEGAEEAPPDPKEKKEKKSKD